MLELVGAWGPIYSRIRGGARERSYSGEQLWRASGWTGGLGYWATVDWATSSIPGLSSIEDGLHPMNSMKRLTGTCRRQRARSLVPGHGDGATVITEERTATRSSLVVCAVRRTPFCVVGL